MGVFGGDSSWLGWSGEIRSEEHTSELQSLTNLVCRLLLEKKKKLNKTQSNCCTREKYSKNGTAQEVPIRMPYDRTKRFVTIVSPLEIQPYTALSSVLRSRV